MKEALNEMGHLKGPSEDSFLALFFQKCWNIVERDLIEFCLKILYDGMDIIPINLTNIMLIPKVAHPLNINNFKPINLCNVLYKIVAKVKTNCLKVVIGKCIDNAQSAFVHERLINYNVLLAYEFLHSF